MAKGFKQASNSLDEKVSKASEHIAEKTDKPEMAELPRVTEPTGSSGGVKFGKGFSPGAADVHKKDKADYDTKANYINPIKPTENVAEESVKNPSTYYDKPLPKSKKKSHKGLIIGIAAVIVVCAVIGGKAISQLSNNNKSNISTVGTEYSSSDNSSTTASTEYSSSDNSSTTANSNNYVKTKDGSDYVFSTFSNYAHTYETQQIPLAGMKSDEASNYDKTTISLPAEMEGGDKNFVGSINPAGVTFKWKSSHNKNEAAAPLGKSSITIKYGELNNEPGSVFKSYLSEFNKVYNETTNSYVVTYDSSKYKSSDQTKTSAEKKLTFKEMCQKSFDDIQQILQNADIEDYSYTNNTIYLKAKTQNCSVKENYYYSSNVCAREMIIINPFHNSIEIKMMKAVNCGDSVRVIYSNYFNNTGLITIRSATDLKESDLKDLYQIEETMKAF